MSVDSVSQTSSILSSATSTSAVKGNDSLDKDAFLKLFVTQLKNQDPLSPMENTEFIAQLAQFSSLEQLTNLNSTLGSNNTLTQSVHDTMLTNLIGKQIEVETGTLTLSDAKAPEIVYQAAEAGHAYAWISQNGTTVRQIDLGEVKSGLNGFTWDGKDSLDVSASDGTYDVKVMLENATGASTELTTMMQGAVKALYYQDGEAVLYMDGQIVNPDAIIAVLE